MEEREDSMSGLMEEWISEEFDDRLGGAGVPSEESCFGEIFASCGSGSSFGASWLSRRSYLWLCESYLTSSSRLSGSCISGFSIGCFVASCANFISF